jgi:uncharacterized protein Yka (UPF0111/DUF47 family)
MEEDKKRLEELNKELDRIERRVFLGGDEFGYDLLWIKEIEDEIDEIESRIGKQ